MNVGQRRRLRREDRKEELTEAAERLLRVVGPAVRVEDVVREAGAAKGTFFKYFPSWDDLLDEVRTRVFADFDARYPLPTEIDGPLNWPAVISWQAAAFIDFTVSMGRIHDVLFHSDFAQRRPEGDKALRRLSAIIRAGQEADAFAPVEPEAAARLLFAAVHEAADAVRAGADRDTMLGAATELLRRALAP